MSRAFAVLVTAAACAAVLTAQPRQEIAVNDTLVFRERHVDS